jgi:F-type H+-transporting ATPase subunit a
MNSNIAADTLQTAVDTLKHAGGNDSGWILHHIMDGLELDFMPFGTIHIPQFPLLFGIDITPTKHVIFMWLAALLVLITFIVVARSYKKSLVPKGISNFFEVLIVFVRDEIAKQTIGKGYEGFVPFLLSLFFFILFGNFIGLVPWSSTFTSNIAATAGLAIISFFAIQIGGIKQNGFLGYFKGLIPHGIPAGFIPLMALVEFLGLFTKPFALCIRLFANMIAGHTVIFALLGLIFFMGSAFVGVVAVPFALFIYLLEILVALIQAYIFTILTSLFIGMAVHQEH